MKHNSKGSTAGSMRPVTPTMNGIRGTHNSVTTVPRQQAQGSMGQSKNTYKGSPRYLK